LIRVGAKQLLAIFLVVILLIVVGLYVLVATPAGTRWLVARTEPFLPEQLSLDGVGGSLLSGLSVAEVRWRDAATDVTARNIDTNLSFRPLLVKHVAVQSLQVESVAVVLRTPSPDTVESEPFSIDLPLKISIASSEMRNFSVDMPDQSVHLDVIKLSAEIDGNQLVVDSVSITSDWLRLNGGARTSLGSPYDIEGHVDWQLERIVPQPMSGIFSIEGDANAYQVEHQLNLPFELHTEGVIQLGGSVPTFNVENFWSEVRWPIDETRTLTSTGGELKVNGDLSEFTTVGSATLQLQAWPESMLQIEGHGSTSHFELSSLRLDSTLADLVASGQVDWRNEPNWTIFFELTELQLDQVQTELDGTVNAGGSLSGKFSATQQLELGMHVDRLSGDLNDNPLNGDIALSMQDETIEIADSWISVGRNRLHGSGRVTPDLDMVVDWSVEAVDEILATADGSSEGNMAIRRDELGWNLEGEASAVDVSWRNYSVAAINMDANIAADGTLAGKLEAGSIGIDDLLITTLQASTAGSFQDHTVQIDVVADDRTLEIHAAGAYMDEAWTGVVDAIAFNDGNRTTWKNERDVELNISSTTNVVDACLLEVDSNSRLCVDADYTGAAAKVNALVEDVPLSLLPISLPAEDFNLAGSVRGELALDWQAQQLNGTATLSLVDAAIHAGNEDEQLTARLDEGVAQASIVNNSLTATADLRVEKSGYARSSISIADITDPQSTLDGAVTIELVDLTFLPLLVPSISETRGTVRGTLNVSGEISDPAMGGNLLLEGGAFQASSAGISVSNITAIVSQGGDGRLSLEGSANSGDGEILLTGDSHVDADAGLQANVTITGNNFEFVRLPEWQAVASPNINIMLGSESASIRGTLDVPRAKVTLQSLPETAERVAPDAIVHGREDRPSSSARRLDLDVETTLGEDVQLTGFGLDTNLTGALRLSGGSDDPLIGVGRIDLREGRYEAYGQDLTIENGALLFSGPLTNPTLDIRAVRDVGDVTAGLLLSGTPDDLRSTVFSEPALSDAEALSYLIAGRPLEVADDEESNRIGQAAFALGLTGADKVIAQLQSKLGLDTLSLDSKDDVGRIVAGRRIGGRLLVEYGYGLVDRLGTLLLRYQLNDRVVVETTTGTASTLDIVYSVKKN